MTNSVSEKISTFFKKYPEKSFIKDEIIISPHNDVHHTYYIEQGHVRMFSISPKGVELTLHIFEKHSFFPLTNTINSTKNTYFFDALTPTIIRKATVSEVEVFLKSEPDVLYDLTGRLLRGLTGMVKRTEMLATYTARQRLLEAILYLAKHFGKDENEKTILTQRFTHRDIASIVGVARETVSAELSELQKKGLVNIDNNLLVIPSIEDIQQEIRGSQ